MCHIGINREGNGVINCDINNDLFRFIGQLETSHKWRNNKRMVQHRGVSNVVSEIIDECHIWISFFILPFFSGKCLTNVTVVLCRS